MEIVDITDFSLLCNDRILYLGFVCDYAEYIMVKLVVTRFLHVIFCVICVYILASVI